MQGTTLGFDSTAAVVLTVDAVLIVATLIVSSSLFRVVFDGSQLVLALLVFSLTYPAGLAFGSGLSSCRYWSV
jgi:hypothetical protein